MQYIIKATLQQIGLIIRDAEYRTLLLLPCKKGLKAFVVVFVVWAVLTFIGCQFGDMFFQGASIWLFIFANVLSVIFIPPLIAFLYFSFFCEEEYCAIAKYCFEIQRGKEQSITDFVINNDYSFSRFVGYILILFTFLFFCLIGSLFFPLLGLLIAGVLLFWDFSSYIFILSRSNYQSRIHFIFSNILFVLLAAFFFSCVCLIPFSILFFYPIGVGICTMAVLYAVNE